jgi:hypothetical protein
VATVRIHDRQENSNIVIDLRHVLVTLGTRAYESSWEVDGVQSQDEPLMVVGDTVAGRLEALAQTNTRITGEELTKLAGSITQIIWGEFRAYDIGCERPWVVVRAFDSSWYEVTSDETAVIRQIESAFLDVREV